MVTSIEVHALLQKCLRSRSDLGLWKAVQGMVMQPHGPFESRPARTLQRWFVLFLIVATVLLAAFIYFNFWS